MSGAILFNCTLTGNSANAGGAGGGAVDCTLYNCTLSGNQGYFGGGAYGSTLYNCTLVGHSAGTTNWGPGYSGQGGGAYGCTLYNCTLSGNSAVGDGGGGVYSSTLFNSIVYFNGPPGTNYDASSTLSYCWTTPLPNGNISSNPEFVDYANGNLHLQSNSPCINSGNNAYVSTATDLDGNPRIVGGTVDIGAYEFQKPTSIISHAWLQQYGLPTDGSVDFIDTDRDGMNNWQEWRCGTCPTRADSVLRLLSSQRIGTDVSVNWQSVAGVNYSLERSTNLSATPAFTPLASGILGQSGTTSYTDTNAASASSIFYRVGVAQ